MSQLAGSFHIRHINMMKIIHCMPNRASAVLVTRELNKLTDVDVRYCYDPAMGNDRSGDWAIYIHEDDGDKLDYDRLTDLAVQIVLADALREHFPVHPLLELWSLDPKNR